MLIARAIAIGLFRRSKSLAQLIADLFSQGQQSAWYDPSDMSTLYQDSAGATPVTAVEQPVGLMLDKSGRGNHASQATAASRTVLSARVNKLLATDVLSTQSVTVAASSNILSFTGTGTITLSGASVAGPLVGTGPTNRVSLSFTPTAGVLTLTVTGSVTLAQLEDGTTATRYQRVNTASDYDTAGFPVYVNFDGVDDSMSSATGGGGTAGFFWCGVVKQNTSTLMTLWSDTTNNTGYIVRLSATGRLQLYAGIGTAYDFAETSDTVLIGSAGLRTVWHDGTALSVQNNSGQVTTTAHALTSAGTAGFTFGCDNGGVTNPLSGNSYPGVYVRDSGLTASERAQVQAYVRSRAGL